MPRKRSSTDKRSSQLDTRDSLDQQTPQNPLAMSNPESINPNIFNGLNTPTSETLAETVELKTPETQSVAGNTTTELDSEKTLTTNVSAEVQNLVVENSEAAQSTQDTVKVQPVQSENTKAVAPAPAVESHLQKTPDEEIRHTLSAIEALRLHLNALNFEAAKAGTLSISSEQIETELNVRQKQNQIHTDQYLAMKRSFDLRETTTHACLNFFMNSLTSQPTKNELLPENVNATLVAWIGKFKERKPHEKNTERKYETAPELTHLLSKEAMHFKKSFKTFLDRLDEKRYSATINNKYAVFIAELTETLKSLKPVNHTEGECVDTSQPWLEKEKTADTKLNKFALEYKNVAPQTMTDHLQSQRNQHAPQANESQADRKARLERISGIEEMSNLHRQKAVALDTEKRSRNAKQEARKQFAELPSTLLEEFSNLNLYGKNFWNNVITWPQREAVTKTLMPAFKKHVEMGNALYAPETSNAHSAEVEKMTRYGISKPK